jgi:ADP-ribose pyrophosphatase
VGDLRDVPESWPVHGTEDIWRGAAPFAVRRDRISVPDAPEAQFPRVVVEHPGAAVVLAVDDRERAFVLRQYRHPAHTRFVELPAGLVDGPGEDPLVAAKRELREEALLLARSWTHLVTMFPSPGLSGEQIDIFLAREVSAAPDRGGFEPEHEEADMTTAWVPVDDLLEGVFARRLTDGPLALAVLAYDARYRRSPADGRRRQ